MVLGRALGVCLAVARAIRSRSVDLGLAEDTVNAADDEIETVTSLAPIRGWVFVRSGHPLASRPGVTLTDLLDFPFAQVVMLPPRLLKPMLAARRPQAGGPALPFPALECATVRLAIGAVAHSDAFTFGTLAQVRHDLAAERIVPLMQPLGKTLKVYGMSQRRTPFCLLDFKKSLTGRR